MKIKFTIRKLVLFVSCLLTLSAEAQELWKKIPLPQNDSRNTKESHYGLYELNMQDFGNALKTVPAEGTRNTSASISIPKPGGELIPFFFEETQLYTPQAGATLIAKTYTGYNKDKTASIHLTVFGNKVYGLAIQHELTWFISSPADPAATGIEVYDDEARPFNPVIPKCEADGRQPGLTGNINGGNNTTSRTPSAACSLKIYRLAIAGTSDYTAYFGSQAAALANSVAMVNNLNALYEREVTVRFTIVSSESLMYNDAAADPFTNSGASPCNEVAISRDNFATALGTANYDLGMTLYGQNFGGCAYVGAVCSNNNKGGGVSGYNVPTPTSYLLEVTAHEVGHLFSAGHTHNAVSSACSVTATSAWEPGGGSTIMAYATACVPSYTKLNTGLYFHGGSLGQMRTYIASASGGCYTTNGTNNTTPLITTATDNTFYIPISTPFKLSADASDAEDNNTLTYTFEQMDLGTGSSVAPTPATASGPVIRSFEPAAKSYRYIPRMDSILVNITPVFESLPSVSRNLTFWATVRDNHSGCGCTSVDTILVATSGSTPFRVTSQPTAITATAGSTVTINWDIAGTTAAPFNTSNVQILFAGDGYNYNTVLSSSTANDGTEQVSLPNIATTSGRIMVAAVGNIFFDINDANITIQPACTNVQTSQIYPEDNLFATAGSSALQLSLFPAFGQPKDTLAGEILATDPAGSIAVRASSTDPSCGTSYSGRYDVYRFQVVTAGSYSVSRTNGTLTGAFQFYSLYSSGGYNPASICTNYLNLSNAYLSPSSIFVTGGFSFTATANTQYVIPFQQFGSSTYGTYRINFSGPGKIFNEFQNAASNYGYVVVNSAGNIVLTSTSSPDLTGLTAGTYYVYGVSSSTGFNLAAYQNQPYSSLETGSFTGGNCASTSNNRKQVTITQATILPLTYVQLIAKAATNGNRLSWKVSDDDDVNGAVIEHSTDGITYTVIATLAKGQNRVATAQYEYLHSTQAAGKHLYRIRQYNQRGGFLNSNVAMVNLSAKTFITISPNPTAGQVTITTVGQAATLPFTLKVYDNSGRLVKQVLVNRAVYSLDLSALASGVYLLAGDGFAEKLIKK